MENSPKAICLWEGEFCSAARASERKSLHKEQCHSVHKKQKGRRQSAVKRRVIMGFPVELLVLKQIIIDEALHGLGPLGRRRK